MVGNRRSAGLHQPRRSRHPIPKAEQTMLFGKSLTRVLMLAAAVLCAATMIPSPARAAFDLWSSQEIYTNSSGSLQFIELTDSRPTDTTGFQNFVNGQTINVSNVGATQ